ncbi:TldD/PmbA family protein [Candidatus Omnitrophota bacterium]
MQKALGGLDADYAEIRVEQAARTELLYQGPELETIGSSLALGGCVRVCINGGWGFSSFNRMEDAESSAKTACKLAGISAGDKTVLSPVEPVTAVIEWQGGTDPSTVSLVDKRDLLKSYNDRLFNAEGIVTTQSGYRDTKRIVWLATNEGTSIRREDVIAGVSLMAVAKDGANVQRGFQSFGDQRGYETVLNREDDVEKIIKTTRDLITAPKVVGGTYTVVINPSLAGVFAHEAFGHLSEADFVYQDPKAREMMKLGRRFGPDFLNIVDDGNLHGEVGYVPYDDEGVRGQRTYLIRDGLLVGRLHSRETAGIMGEQPTGNARAINTSFRPIVRMTNTLIENGDVSFESMISGIKDGIYACNFIGGMTDLERFTFSSAYAFKIENGRITTPVRDVILSGNVFETLKNISMIGNDLEMIGGLGGCGKGDQSPLPASHGSPHIRIDNVLVG